MAELSEDEKQSLDDALSTLDDLYEATLKPDGGFRSEQRKPSRSWPKRRWVACCLCWTRKCTTRFSATLSERKLGREARALRTLTLRDEVPAQTLMLLDEVPHWWRRMAS
jgi:hypothetical protein